MVLLIVATTSGVPLITGLILYGLSFCCVMPLLMLILMDLPEVGSKYMGSAAGMFFCVAEVGGFTGPFIIGAIKDLTGGFLLGASFIAGLALAMSIIALFLKTRPASDTKVSS